MMPKRSRRGLVKSPARVVAPTRVKRGTASFKVEAAGPLPVEMKKDFEEPPVVFGK